MLVGDVFWVADLRFGNWRAMKCVLTEIPTIKLSTPEGRQYENYTVNDIHRTEKEMWANLLEDDSVSAEDRVKIQNRIRELNKE